MHNKKTVVALGYYDLRMNGKYILVRRHEAGHLVVNVMQITSKPTFVKNKSVTTFMAKGLLVNGRELSEADGALIEELTVNDIGCPWKASPAGIECRTFHYDDDVHQILLSLVRSQPGQWGVRFTYQKVGIEIEYLSVSSTDPIRQLSRQTAACGIKY